MNVHILLKDVSKKEHSVKSLSWKRELILTVQFHKDINIFRGYIQQTVKKNKLEGEMKSLRFCVKGMEDSKNINSYRYFEWTFDTSCNVTSFKEISKTDYSNFSY